MPVPTGTSTPWREIEDPSLEGGGGHSVTYFCPGTVAGPADLLAEQLRADGLIRSTGPAIGAATRADLYLGWYGLNDEGLEELCDEQGWTAAGEEVDRPRRCILARVDTSED